MNPISESAAPRRAFNWSAAVAILVLVVILLGARYITQHFRRPGSMSVIEAQGMDMSAMKPPLGAVPVEVATVIGGLVQARVSYTGSVVAFNDEQIAPRVTGRLLALPVYPGDRVRRGQLLARLDSDELRAKEQGARFARATAGQDALVAADEAAAARAARVQASTEELRSDAMAQEAAAAITHAQASAQEARLTVKAQGSSVAQARSAAVAAREDKRMAQADLEENQAALTSAQGEVENAQAMAQSTAQRLPQAEADVEAARAEEQLAHARRDRSAELLKQGAISTEEFQTDETAWRNATAKMSAAQSHVIEVQNDVSAARAKVSQSQSGVRGAGAKIRGSQAALTRATANITAADEKVVEAQAEAQVAQIKVVHAHADTDMARARLAQARADVQNARAAAQGAVAGVGKATHQAGRATTMEEQADAQLAEAAIVRGYTEIRADTDGVVSKRLVSPGSLVSPGTVLLQIAQIDRVRFQASVAQSDLDTVRVGTPVTIRSIASPARRLQTVISAVFPAADATSRTGIVEAVADNTGARFKPGEYIIMDIATSTTGGALKVPSEALVMAPTGGGAGQTVALGETASVWVMEQRHAHQAAIYTCTMHPQIRQEKPGLCPICHMQLTPLEAGGNFRARLTRIKTGASDGDYTEVLGGLQSGAQVITRGYDDLKDGDAVVPTTFDANGSLDLPPTANSAEQSQPGMGGMDMGKPGMTASQQTSASASVTGSIRVLVGATGFSPASFALRKGVTAHITFIRTTNATCATEINWPDYGIKQALALNKPVTITITPKKNGAPQTTFACGMNMFKGTVTLR